MPGCNNTRLCPSLQPSLLSHLRNRSCNESLIFPEYVRYFNICQSTYDILSIEGKYILYHIYFTVSFGLLTSLMSNSIASSKIVHRILRYRTYSGKIRRPLQDRLRRWPRSQPRRASPVASAFPPSPPT